MEDAGGPACPVSRTTLRIMQPLPALASCPGTWALGALREVGRAATAHPKPVALGSLYPFCPDQHGAQGGSLAWPCFWLCPPLPRPHGVVRRPQTQESGCVLWWDRDKLGSRKWLHSSELLPGPGLAGAARGHPRVSQTSGRQMDAATAQRLQARRKGRRNKHGINRGCGPRWSTLPRQCDSWH